MTMTAWIDYCKGDMSAPAKHKGRNLWDGNVKCRVCRPWECNACVDGFGLGCPATPDKRWLFVPDPTDERDKAAFAEFCKQFPRYVQLTLF